MAQVMPLNSDDTSSSPVPEVELHPHPAADAEVGLSAAGDSLAPIAAKFDLEAAAPVGADGADGGEKPPVYVDVSYMDITREFSLLGYIGFGGPAAHIGLFQKVRRCCCLVPTMQRQGGLLRTSGCSRRSAGSMLPCIMLRKYHASTDSSRRVIALTRSRLTSEWSTHGNTVSARAPATCATHPRTFTLAHPRTSPLHDSYTQRLVEGKKWLSETLFLELFALGSCLPGPTSTQVRGGKTGAFEECRESIPIHSIPG